MKMKFVMPVSLTPTLSQWARGRTNRFASFTLRTMLLAFTKLADRLRDEISSGVLKDTRMMAKYKMASTIMGALLMIAPHSGSALAVPSTFSTTIGSALLCLDQIDPFYFWSYLNQFFGPPYKNEGGAYWFKVQTTLWGTPISDVMVSDGSGQVIFLAAAFTNTKPDALSGAISGSTGIGYKVSEPIQHSPLMSNLGSKIVYFGQDSKVFCAKYNPTYFQSHPE